MSRVTDYTSQDCVIVGWDDGWYVEVPSPTNVTNAIPVAGPFKTNDEAERFIDRLRERESA